MSNFLNILAWIFGVLSSMKIVCAIIASAMYSDLDKIKDQLKGQTRSFSILKPFCVAVVCWAWIIAGGS